MHMVCMSKTSVFEGMVTFSLVLGRASLIGSQTRGVSVLHNKVCRHRENRTQDSFGASEREKPLSGIQSLVTQHHRLGSSRGPSPQLLSKEI